MASHTISGSPWADGTTVGVYPAVAVPAGSDVPSGAAITSGVVASGSVTFSSAGLTTRTRYYAYGGGKGVAFLIPVTSTEGDRARIEALEAGSGSVEVTGGGGAITAFEPETYGAVRNGVTDDTAALKSCVAAAVAACIADGTYVCKVLLSPGVYQCSSATTKGGATLGNAQIPLPVVIPETSQKVILIFEGGGKSSSIHWAQTQSLAIGSVIRSSLTGLTNDATWGAPSVIGGPTTQVGTNPLAPYFSNMHVVFDGVTVMAPDDPTMIGVDLRGCAQASIVDLACTTNTNAAGMVTPVNSGGVGLYMPSPGNNAVADIGSYTCQGFYYGLATAEHLAANRLLLVYCNTAMFCSAIRNAIGTNHTIAINYMCAEAVSTVIETNASGQTFGVFINSLDLEIADTGTHISDALNGLRGEVRWHDYQAVTPRVSGAAHLRIIDTVIARGAFTPALPATTVASTPIFRDMALTVSGGTVTAIAVDGVAQGVTSGTVFVPSGKTFAITYSVAPTLRGVKL